ncbi:RHS repeat domain-containing protein [Ruminiclostridium papyrosolvens]|uniref:Uncharacterized protein n=1 Tax=Ruminiclostridium papyrosolvens C7 TaxID=1330534 RepID=U4R6Y2_9FIRM|nr:RHS repeat-associated core domain-containing protein [Ruminiclostridium papyrosolvens]EPR13762.1 hypothetical protein L323_03225 [Ruminiclostridium papyrosolvens C7]
MTVVTSSNRGSIVYTYDNNGNQLTSSDGTTYTYDGFNQLKSVEQADGSWMENHYDAFGLRISVTENGIGSNFTYDRGNIITETNGNGSLVSRNIRGLGLIARENPIGTKAYYLNNAHGDVSKLVNENGEVLNSYEYDSFGNATSSKEKVQNRFQYAGEQLDKVTGQYYLRARHYDPATGRFITEDTYRGQLDNTKSLNLYTYCENNPIIYVDPSGHLKSSGEDFWYILDDSNSTYSYYINQIYKAGEWNVIAQIFDWAYNIGINTYIGYTSAGAGYWPNEINVMSGLYGAIQGYIDAASGAGMGDVARKHLDDLENKFVNLGDQAYRNRTVSGRKDIIDQMNAYIKNLQNELCNIRKHIDEETKSNNNYYIKIHSAYMAGMITKNKYNEYMKSYKNWLGYVNNLKIIYKPKESRLRSKN